MIEFSSVSVFGLAVDYYDIHWELKPHSSSIADWQFFVERSETEGGPFEVIAGPLYDQYDLRDNDVYTLNQLRTWFYRVRACRPHDGREVVSDVADAEGPEDLIAAEIIRAEYVMWREYAGTAHWVFKKRTFGQRCPACFNSIIGAVTTPNCEVCWGTGFAGGYHRPIKIWGQSFSDDVQMVRTPQDQSAPSYGTFTGPPSPDITIGDIIVDSRGKRFSVVQLGGSTRLGVTVRQTAQLSPIERSQIVHKIPLNIDTSVELLRAPRNFTNPHNLSAAQDTLPAPSHSGGDEP